MARLPRRAATQSPTAWNADPDVGQGVAQVRDRRRRLGDDQRVGREFACLATDGGPDSRRTRPPRSDHRGRGGPATGLSESLAQRAVRRAMEQTGGHDRCGRHDRHVVAALDQVERRPDPAPVTQVVEHDDARTGRRQSRPGWPGSRRPRAHRRPGRRSCSGRARWNPVTRRPRPGREDDLVRPDGLPRPPRPVASPSRTSTPRPASERSYQASRSVI